MMTHCWRYNFPSNVLLFPGRYMLVFGLFWLGCVCCGWGNLSAQDMAERSNFIICYNPSMSSEKFASYDIVVVDYAYPPKSIAALRRQGKLVFGYLSLGKVQKQRPYLLAVQQAGIALQQDVNFPDSLRIDAGDQKWHALVVESIIPKMKEDGFAGIFLDDLDDLKIRSLQDQGVALIQRIRKSNPHLQLMANRGLEYADRFSPSVDYLLLESCFLQNGRKRDPSESAWALQLLSVAKAANPKLKGVAIDYISEKKVPLNSDQKRLILEIQGSHEQNNLLSCVSSRDLQSVPSISDN